jgi:hypothetical protein
MSNLKSKLLLLSIVVLLMLVATPLLSVTPTRAADHAEAPFAAADPDADLADVYFFLDPNDNSKVILAMDVAGFIVPSESLNLCCFSSEIVYRFEIENTGDNKPDKFIDITFEEQYNRRAPQAATIKFSDGPSFTALTTVNSQRGNVNDVSLPNPFRVTTDPTTGVSFFAGLVDDPFFFDIIGFNRYVIKLVDRNPTAKTDLTRARDSFAGFNAHMMALSIPAAMLKGNSNVVGVNGITLRHKDVTRNPGGGEVAKSNAMVQIDRMATPVINTVLITSLQRKNEYNASSAADQAQFDGDLAFTFRFIRTSDESSMAVRGLLKNGDYLRLDLTKPNTNLGTGENLATPGFAGFPNGRRPGDDTIDTILFFVNSLQPLADNVNANDVPFVDKFPFFGLPHQALRPGEDDGTAF